MNPQAGRYQGDTVFFGQVAIFPQTMTKKQIPVYYLQQLTAGFAEKIRVVD